MFFIANKYQGSITELFARIIFRTVLKYGVLGVARILVLRELDTSKVINLLLCNWL